MSAFTPKFDHRLSNIHSGNDPLKLGDLTDTVLLSCERATAILHLISLQFEGEEVAKCSNAITANALDAAINEIKDIAAITRAYQRQDSNQPHASDIGGAA